ncbi:hypothetical protein PTKIN_Ptkin12aG0098900 [Pterospermum kingtungense]
MAAAPAEFEGFMWIREHARKYGAKINQNSKFKMIREVRDVIASLGQEAVDDIKQSTFGRLLDFDRHARLSGVILHQIIAHQFTFKGIGPHEAWFRIGNESICFKKNEFCLITGLKFGTSDFDPNMVYTPREDGLWKKSWSLYLVMYEAMFDPRFGNSLMIRLHGINSLGFVPPKDPIPGRSTLSRSSTSTVNARSRTSNTKMGTTKKLVANRHQHKIPHESHKMKRRSASVLDDSLHVRLDDLVIRVRKRRKLRFTMEDPQRDSEEQVTMDPNITSTANAYTKKSRKKRNSSLHRKLRQRNASSCLHSHLSSSRLRSALQRELPGVLRRELPGVLLDVLPEVLQRVFPIGLPEFLQKFNESKNHGQKDGSLNDPKASRDKPLLEAEYHKFTTLYTDLVGHNQPEPYPTGLIDYVQGIQPWWGEQLWTVQFFILVCNIHKHWVTCEVNLTAWAITVYDSLQPIHDEDNLWWNQRCLDLLPLSILLHSMLREEGILRNLI